ncbi:nuclear transport factor 2 family protein [Gordonia sp. zg691]|uniref:Nuclear transport factor 2 family protein n=1 Tax=Gordonia jinghuaiqii TaxID=2758710 RepID=A0A7D7LXN1_9ACTN|nr:nuclear transport factor 2 family protein [Gordonia jinghuaiqii]MBD0861733.1 nuclear transport factor 2 family protein [Gordonia jinghuaiqii]MCR5977625.1 steroid delta-isomerase [Gordonia jinghuaiqii]QMT02299.1 nuclear transport factor 2 family protein [Gordonia jinghuaiqii]
MTIDTGTAVDTTALVSRYLATISNGSSTDIAALYAPDARLEDPVGAEPRIGRTAIEEFYRGLDGTDTTAELLVVRAVGREAAFHFRVTTKLPEGSFVVEPIDVMTFDATGAITSMRAFWAPGDMKTQDNPTPMSSGD